MMSIMAKTRRYVLQKLQLYFQHGFSGASLIQIYSGLIYRGPALVGEIAQALCRTEASS